MKTIYIYILIILIPVFSCTKTPNGGIPTYIHLSNPTIDITNIEQGTAVHEFSDLWIESEGLNLGVYEYPKTIPSLLKGEKEIIINAGIELNADNLKRRIYPILEPYKNTFNFIQKDTLYIQPVFKYRSGINFLYIEDFQTTNNFDNIDRTTISDPMNIDGKSGVLTMSSSETTINAETIDAIEIPYGKRVYVEFNLKTDSYVDIGFSSENSTEFKSLGIYKPNKDWHTSYYEITNFINGTKEGKYNFYLNAQKAVEGVEEKIYFDNLKIIEY